MNNIIKYCTLDDKIVARPGHGNHALLCSAVWISHDKGIKPPYYNHNSALHVYNWSYSHYHYSIEEITPNYSHWLSAQRKALLTCISHVVNLGALDNYSDIRADVKSKAGYKDPTCFFTTNSCESLNHLITQEVEWKESQLPNLIDSLKAITNDHHSEL